MVVAWHFYLVELSEYQRDFYPYRHSSVSKYSQLIERGFSSEDFHIEKLVNSVIWVAGCVDG